MLHVCSIHKFSCVDCAVYMQGAKGSKNDAGAKPQLQLLHNISGTFRPGVLTALMGVSGAGKTTLMDVLADRKTAGRVEGQVSVGGHPKDKHSFARVCGYVEQNDIHSARVSRRLTSDHALMDCISSCALCCGGFFFRQLLPR